eukprot:CAMPEP_0197930286 /NCGR_PEP_ID=MMETSP1439-20131203/105226_1 /TAXON_ID=66791 /ORGANISM="Gonyaulax spinifera, Strain CCMP409" /LENGTH=67 /DNA_ID=CAMNT_0043552973 /DNA_START=63 /DNA_END=262 /DNA_ORIENTATION=+
MAFVGPMQRSTSGRTVVIRQANHLAAPALGLPPRAAEAASFYASPRAASSTWMPLACATLLVACVAG